MMPRDGMFARRWPMGLGIAAVVAGAAALSLLHRSPRGVNETVRRAPAVREDLRLTKTATGEATPQNRVEIKPPIAGRIEQVLVREGELVTTGQVLAWMSSEERAALLDAARAQGVDALARWETAYKPAPLIAPLNGTVIVRAVEPGQTVTTNDPVVVIADRLIVKGQVDETDISAIAIGQPAEIALDAFPQAVIPARVDHVAYEAKTVNNVTVYEVDVLPTQVPEFMRSGMTATVTFTVAFKSGALVVPAEAVHQGRSGATVLIPGAASWARPASRSVTVGMTDGKSTEIVSGLQDGEIVLSPSLRLPRATEHRRTSPLAPRR